MTKQYLQIEGASIYFEVKGTGLYLIFVLGGDGQGAIFALLSKITGPQDYENRLDIEADDIYNLMRSLTNQNFTLFGTSSGGAVSLKYFARYP
ncbi:hypothetical protein EDC94DRAFT_658042 [Helicostylum pulchrum]|nr:hypothetical protein EDC94DRAFT_658042 [Helicostylum pulchrum]